jgi:hypothetical protein
MQTSTSEHPPKWPKVLALVALIAGLLVGLVALIAALGVWAGLWDFRLGFGMLRIVNLVALWVAIGGVIIALAVYFGSRSSPRNNGVGLAGLALIGAFAAALAWTVPESYRPAEGTPPIHDITTDTENPPQFVDVLPLRADAPNSAVYGESPNMTPEKLAQLQKEAYPDITTQVYDEPMEDVFARALAAVDELGWELVAAAPEEGRIEATDTTFWFRFKDDIVIGMVEKGGKIHVDARSVSRVGVSDVGKNAERLREFFEKLEA